VWRLRTFPVFGRGLFHGLLLGSSFRTDRMSTTLADNPLLTASFRIPFHRIEATHVVPGVRRLIEHADAEIEELAGNPDPPAWGNTIGRLDEIVRRMREGTAPVHHLLAVAESQALRDAWAEVLPEVSSFWTRLHLHEGLWARLKAFAQSPAGKGLEGLRSRHLEKTLREFRRSGADLPPEDRARLEEIEVEVAQLEQRFSEHVLDATADWKLHLTDREELEGIPPDSLRRFAGEARREGLDGWLIKLDAPSVQAVLKRARSRELRRTVHQAYHDRGRRDPWDNRPLIPRILALRREKARLLGYADFPDFRLEEQMARSGAEARTFVSEMVERTRPYWERDLGILKEAGRERGLDPIRPWDVAFLIEELRRERFDLDEEELRAYFPLDRVVEGMFELTRRLFGLEVRERPIEEVWHDEVRHYEIFAADGRHMGSFYADFYPRPEKRQGAWMNDFIHGRPVAGGEDGDEALLSPHLGVICANVPPPSDETPALLTHRDVETLFHEFGHLLHHCTSRVPIPQRGGINVAWDWVEVPSQLLENWAWEREALDLFARHWETGLPLPPELHDRMLRSRRFMGGWSQMRQLTFGTLDLALHTDFDPDRDADAVEWVTELLLPLSPDRRFAESHPLPAFLHLFSGGYAASYYSYLWSEVMEADLFTRFLERGIFDRETGTRYLEAILSAGDRDDPERLFRSFMDREPDAEALIRRNLGDAA
jgi:oligopeptidase A